QTGKVTAVAVGKATITATAANGTAGKYTVTVEPHTHDFDDDGICKTCGNKKLLMSGGTINNKDILTAYTDWSNSVKEVVIPEGVKGIGKSAFQGNSVLESVTIPDSVTSIGESAFFQCKSLKNVNMGKGVTSIGKSAFSYTALESVTIGDSVEIIEDYAFYPCNNLKNITLPASVKKIGLEFTAFQMPLNQTATVTYKGTLKQWCAVDSMQSFVIFSQSMVLEGENNFDLKIATELKIPDGVTKIGKSAFFGCQKLEKVTIPASVTEIGANAFANCIFLTDVAIPDNVTSIGVNAFYACSFTSMKIPDSVTSIGAYVFDKCNRLKEVTIGNGITEIGEGAFNDCNSLETVTYNGTEKQWKAIKGINDIGLLGRTTVTVSGGKTLTYNSSTKKWE
ncbi:MAG: leucine-rich repeat protein, partial [Treponemataceae bacterium]|nr:leucine-rich repeat protein [Treponemataceae bacterium]